MVREIRCLLVRCPGRSDPTEMAAFPSCFWQGPLSDFEVHRKHECGGTGSQSFYGCKGYDRLTNSSIDPDTTREELMKMSMKRLLVFSSSLDATCQNRKNFQLSLSAIICARHKVMYSDILDNFCRKSLVHRHNYGSANKIPNIFRG